MSQNQSYSNVSSSSVSYSFSSSSSSSNSNGQVSGHRSMQSSYTDPSGTTTRSATQNLGQPIIEETRRYDTQGRELLESSGNGAPSRRIEDVSDEEQAKRDREYEERMEDEYAKREGGA